MLTPQELLEIVDTLHPQIDALNAWITTDLISRLMARLGRGEEFLLTGTDQWQIEVYRAAGGHLEALQKEIKRFTEKSDDEVKAIFEDAAIRAWEADDAFYVSKGLDSIRLLQSESMLRLLADTYKRTNVEIHNFTRTTAQSSQQRLIKALDTAHFKVMSGAQSYTQAVKDAVNEIAVEQTKVIYPSGHVDTIETAVFRAVRTGVAQASGNMSLQGMIEHDWDLIRVSAHLGARYGDGGENPSNHFWWQGKLYSRTGRTPGYLLFVDATGYGTGEGCCGWNCRHSIGPGDPEYNPFKTFDSEENKRVYDLSQKQRRAEARIRRQKQKVLGLSEALNQAQDGAVKAELQEEYGKAALQLQKYNSEYNKFCEDNNLKRLSDRISIAKWSRSEAAKATKAAVAVDKDCERAYNISADKDQWERYRELLGGDAPKSFEEFQTLKYDNKEYFSYMKLDYQRRNKLVNHPELSLQNAEKVMVDDRKFTGYLFNPENAAGWAKGKAFTSRLGYGKDNFSELKKEILERAKIYPATLKGSNQYGDRYEQKIILYGKKNTPANVVVGWLKEQGNTKMTSAYIKEVD